MTRVGNLSKWILSSEGNAVWWIDDDESFHGAGVRESFVVGARVQVNATADTDKETKKNRFVACWKWRDDKDDNTDERVLWYTDCT